MYHFNPYVMILFPTTEVFRFSRLIFFAAAVIVFLTSCKAQKSSITLFNKSHFNVDSVYFPHLVKGYPLLIKPGEKRTIAADISMLKKVGEEGLNVFIYLEGKMFSTIFCQDFGQALGGIKNDDIYVFDHGISGTDKGLDEPNEIRVYLINRSNENIDSVVSKIQLKSGKQLTDSLTEVILRYKQFKINPRLEIHQNKKAYSIYIEHDWDNWNINQEIYYLYQNGIIKKHETSVVKRK